MYKIIDIIEKMILKTFQWLFLRKQEIRPVCCKLCAVPRRLFSDRKMHRAVLPAIARHLVHYTGYRGNSPRPLEPH